MKRQKQQQRWRDRRSGICKRQDALRSHLKWKHAETPFADNPRRPRTRRDHTGSTQSTIRSCVQSTHSKGPNAASYRWNFAEGAKWDSRRPVFCSTATIGKTPVMQRLRPHCSNVSCSASAGGSASARCHHVHAQVHEKPVEVFPNHADCVKRTGVLILVRTCGPGLVGLMKLFYYKMQAFVILAPHCCLILEERSPLRTM